jgi:enamine deaminase RidA (YjgF/YER057c/UK114 family)
MTTSTTASPVSPVAFHNPAGLYDPAPNGYSHMATVTNPTRVVLISGQGGENEHGELVPDFRSQVRRALSNLMIALSAADMTCRNVARLTALVVDHDEDKLSIFGEEMALVFQAPAMPACTLIPVPRLALDGMLFELEGTAYA